MSLLFSQNSAGEVVCGLLCDQTRAFKYLDRRATSHSAPKPYFPHVTPKSGYRVCPSPTPLKLQLPLFSSRILSYTVIIALKVLSDGTVLAPSYGSSS